MINWDRVNELRDEVGPDDFGEVVEIFLEEVEEVIYRLGLTPIPANYETDLHFLKGSAVNLGFDDFGALCGAGEILARTHAEDVDIAAVLTCFAESRSIFLEGESKADQAA